MNLKQIPAKIGIKMCINELFMCTKFSLMGVYVCILWPKIRSVQKDVEKRNYFEIFLSDILGLAGAFCSKFGT